MKKTPSNYKQRIFIFSQTHTAQTLLLYSTHTFNEIPSPVVSVSINPFPPFLFENVNIGR